MTQNSHPGEEIDTRPWPGNGPWMGILVARLLVVVLLGSALVSSSIANAAGSWFGGEHRRWGHHGAADPETARERAEFAAEWVLRYVDASDEQHEKVNTIIARSVDEMFALAASHRSNRAASPGASSGSRRGSTRSAPATSRRASRSRGETRWRSSRAASTTPRTA